VRAALEAEPSPPAPQLERLLAERAERQRGMIAAPPTRVPASKFKDYVTDFDSTVRELSRPMPERPYRQTRLGTLFHAWVEHRSGLVGAGPSADAALWDSDEEQPDPSSASAADDADLQTLREIFERSEWARLAPIAVEIEIDFAFGAGHIVICKLDAVYRREDRGGRIEIVDWKTGRAPRTPAEREERMLQLALYRLAYHRRFGVPLDEIDVALYYVADDLIIRGDRVYSEEELVQRWSAARAAR
jgi:DNA helicase-2/ATP-dependent DNA helicase PcrA